VQGRFYQKLGLWLIIASCGMWVAILAAPLLPASTAQKAMFAGSLVILGEVTFWLGILLTGKELAHRYREKLNPYYWWQKLTKR
jgi:hypothetical protein